MSFDLKQVASLIIAIVILLLGDMGFKWVMPAQSTTTATQVSPMPSNYDMIQDSKISVITTDFAVMNQKLDDMNSLLRELKGRSPHSYSETKHIDNDIYAQVKK